jgi:MSHA pilin protein MshA
MRMQAKQSGFTLIELVVVITILAILAAFAVPRFASLEVEARSAATTALGGSVRSAAALSHALWLAQGQPASVSMEGVSIAMVNGYPDESSIGSTLASLDGFVFDDTVSPSLFSKTNDGSTAIASCEVSYLEPANPGEAPSIGVVTGGC